MDLREDFLSSFRGSATAGFYARPAVLAMPLVAKGDSVRSAMIREKCGHLGLDASTVQQDSDSCAWFQLPLSRTISPCALVTTL
jgi:hypothetical protein